MSQTIVQVANVDLIYQERHAETQAIRDLSFSAEEGEFLGVCGPSGCGKTSVLSLLMGLIEPTRGTVRLKDGVHVGYMLQRDHLLEWRTVEENVLLGLQVKRLCTKERRAYALSLLERYGLSGFSGHYPGELSGGMRQKVALIRTLACEPELLLLDEPFSALDYQTRLLIGDEVYAIIKRERKTAILVTHDIAEAVSMSDRVLVFSERPAKLKRTFPIELDRALSPLERRNDPRFASYFNAVWKELEHHDDD